MMAFANVYDLLSQEDSIALITIYVGARMLVIFFCDMKWNSQYLWERIQFWNEFWYLSPKRIVN